MLKIIKKMFGRATEEQPAKSKIGLPDVNGKVDRSMNEISKNDQTLPIINRYSYPGK